MVETGECVNDRRVAPLLFETIRIEEGIPRHLKWHNLRMNRSRAEIFDASVPLDLGEYLRDRPQQGIWRCRITYRESVESVEFLPYQESLQGSIRLILAEFQGEYAYKFRDRAFFERLTDRYPAADDLILCREGWITDTTIANIAVRVGEYWYTPRIPLLRGTTRARLLAEGKLLLKDLPCTIFGEIDELALMNAMIGFRRFGPERFEVVYPHEALRLDPVM